MMMIKNKNGEEMTLKNVLQYLVGTDDMDEAKSVMDFAVYKIDDNKTLDSPSYYMVAVNAIVTQVSFMGPFTMIEVDFRNTGVQLLQQVLEVIKQFHSSINSEDIMMVSTVTSLNKNATHILSLANPLIAIRGYSESGEGSSILQMVYASENVGFSVSNIDYDKIHAEVEREVLEIESAMVSQESINAAQDIIDGMEESDMQKMFKPNFTSDFRITSTEERQREDKSDIRVVGDKKGNEKSVKISSEKTSLIKGSHDEEDDV